MQSGSFIGRFLLIVASAAPAALIAQSDSSAKAKQIVGQAIAALGGDRFLHMQNRVARGRIYAFFHDRLSGLDVTTTYTEYLPERPAKGIALRERELLGKKQDYSYLFLPDQGWDLTFRGARPIPDETWQRYVRTTENDILYILKVRHDEPGLIYDYVGSDVYLSTHVEVVDITDAQSRTVRAYFDHNTLLPIHETFSWLDPDTRTHNDEVIEYDKYRDAGDGIMWPYSIERERNGYKTYQMFATKVEVNQPVPAKTFELPPGAKVLKKVD
jgi:hypothetical protein